MRFIDRKSGGAQGGDILGIFARGKERKKERERSIHAIQEQILQFPHFHQCRLTLTLF